MHVKLILLGLIILAISSCELPVESTSSAKSFAPDKKLNTSVAQFPRTDLGCLPIFWRPFKIDVKGDYAYILDCAFMGSYEDTGIPSSLYIVDCSDKKSPMLVSKVLLNGKAWDVLSMGKFTYIATSTGVQIVNTSDPIKPTLTDLIPTTFYATCLKLHNGYLYVLDSGTYLHVYSIQEPSKPKELFVKQIADVSPSTQSMFFVDNRLYFYHYSGRTRIYDISKPTELVYINEATEYLGIDAFLFQDKYLYTGSQRELGVFDMTDLNNPKLVGTIKHDGYPMVITAVENRLFVLSGRGTLTSYDITNPISPIVLAQASLRTNNMMSNLNESFLDDNFIYTVNDGGQFCIFQFPNDFNDKGKIEPTGSIDAPRNITDFRVKGDYVFALDPHGLAVFDISSKENICSKSLYAFVPATRDMDMVGNGIFITCTKKDEEEVQRIGGEWNRSKDVKLAVIHCKDPENLRVDALIDLPDYPSKFMIVDGKYALVEVDNSTGWNWQPPDLHLIDISDLKHPQTKIVKKSEDLVASWNSDKNYLYILFRRGKLSIYKNSSIESLNPVSEIHVPEGSNGIRVIGKTAFITSNNLSLSRIDLSNINQPVVVENYHNMDLQGKMSKDVLSGLKGKTAHSSFIKCLSRSGLIELTDPKGIWQIEDGPVYVTGENILGLVKEEYRSTDMNVPYGTTLKSFDYSLSAAK